MWVAHNFHLLAVQVNSHSMCCWLCRPFHFAPKSQSTFNWMIGSQKWGDVIEVARLQRMASWDAKRSTQVAPFLIVDSLVQQMLQKIFNNASSACPKKSDGDALEALALFCALSLDATMEPSEKLLMLTITKPAHQLPQSKKNLPASGSHSQSASRSQQKMSTPH